MRLVNKTGQFDSQKMFKGKYKKCDVTIYHSRNRMPYWYFVFNKKDEDYRFNSLWEDMRFSTQEECVSVCEAKIDALVKQWKEKKS